MASLDLEAANSIKDIAESDDQCDDRPKPTRRLTRILTPKIASKAPRYQPLRRRKDIRPREGRTFCFNKSEILEIYSHHNEYHYGGTTLKGLARFDDCRSYGISDEMEGKLINLEIDRLIAAVTTDGPFLFHSNGAFGATKDENFAEVSDVADQIRVNFEIIRHDNTMHVLEHCPDLIETAIGNFKEARRKLLGRYKQDNVRVEGCQPKLIDPPERNLQAYFTLVDYVTGSIGRLLLGSATSKYWENQLLAILAQWATKLKVLSHNPAHYATQSLDQGEDTLVQLIAEMETKSLTIVKIRKAVDASEHKDVDALDQETDITSRYYREKMFFRENLERLLKHSLDALLNSTESFKPKNASFEMCTLVFRTGLDGLPTTLSNSRQGSISASSDAVRVNCSYTAMDLAVRNLTALQPHSHLPERETDRVDRDATVVDWEWSDQTKKVSHMRETLEILKMDDLISVLALLGLTSTYTSSKVDALMALASSGTKEDDPIIQFEPPPQDFEAHITVSTAQHTRKQKDPVVAQYHDPDVCSVSTSSSKLGFRARNKMYSLILGSAAMKQSKHDQAKITAAYERDKQKMYYWAVSEDAVTIKCRRYVIAVILLAMIIIFGGMSVPFAVGTRIRGVDPFQITTFSWIVAGFLVVLAKSRYVNEWPWHDFLRGQVVCRSIKDVCDVTGIDPQVVLMNLLHEERENTLTTKGPYNGMFGRQTEDARGFAIDEPVQLLTMLASGFVILKVINEKGEHLLCLDVRKGVEGVGTLANEDDKVLSCLDVGKDELQTAFDNRSWKRQGGAWPTRARFTKAKQEKVTRLKLHDLRYNKVQGLYIRDSAFG